MLVAGTGHPAIANPPLAQHWSHPRHKVCPTEAVMTSQSRTKQAAAFGQEAGDAKHKQAFEGVKSMRVLALGLPRAGTGSLKKALEHLGIGPVFHGYELVKPQHRHTGWVWEDLVERKYGTEAKISPPLLRCDFEKTLGAFAGTVETPPSAFWEELMGAYPEASIVLLGRDEKQWEKSFIDAITPIIYGWDRNLLSAAMYLGLIPRSPNWFYKQLFQGLFRASSAAEMARNALPVYRAHYAAVEAKAKEDGRLFLKMDVSEGWQPLCGFLGHEIPEIPFPHENAGFNGALVKSMRRSTIKKLLKECGWMAAYGSGAVVAMLVSTLWLLSGRGAAQDLRRS